MFRQSERGCRPRTCQQRDCKDADVNLPKHQASGPNADRGWAQIRVLIILAVGYQWFYNGANFVAFKVGGDAVHPLLLASMRFTIAALIIWPIGLWRLYQRPACRNWRMRRGWARAAEFQTRIISEV